MERVPQRSSVRVEIDSCRLGSEVCVPAGDVKEVAGALEHGAAADEPLGVELVSPLMRRDLETACLPFHDFAREVSGEVGRRALLALRAFGTRHIAREFFSARNTVDAVEGADV